MNTKVKNQNQTSIMKNVLTELEFIKGQLAELLFLIPEESLSGYKNPDRIKKDFLDAIKEYPPN